MNKEKIMIIAHFCDYGDENTNNRFNYIAKMMFEAGNDVELVTSSFSHRNKVQRCKKKDSTYKIKLIYEPTYKRNISLKRLFYSHRIMAQNLKKYLETCQCPDVIYCAIPSIEVAEIAGSFAKKNHIPFIIDVQDLWPEAYKLILKNDRVYNLLTNKMKKRVNRVYAAADTIISVSDTYLKRAAKVNRISKENRSVYLGTDMKSFDEAALQGKVDFQKEDKQIWIAYCGTLGHSYNLEIIFRALKGIDTHKYKFIVMGSGPLQKEFELRARQLGINVLFTGMLQYPEMCAVLQQCDIAVNPIIKGAAQSIINKHGDYAMAGLPVVSTQEKGEYSCLLDEYQCGINCDSENHKEVRNAINELLCDEKKRNIYGKNSRKLAAEKFDRNRTYLFIKEAIEKYL